MDKEKVEARLQEQLQKKSQQQDLFAKRVLVIGELHTKRATWANRIAQLKSISITQGVSLSKNYRERLKTLERQIAEISSEITGFSPDSVEDLTRFQKEVEDHFQALEDYYESTDKVKLEPDERAPEN